MRISFTSDMFGSLETDSEIPLDAICALVDFLIKDHKERFTVKGADMDKIAHELGVFFQLGRHFERSKIRHETVARASNGRRLIGATSRAKVAKAADGLRHFSKEKAATEMADKVILDPGTIRRYLSELFPGDKWKQ